MKYFFVCILCSVVCACSLQQISKAGSSFHIKAASKVNDPDYEDGIVHKPYGYLFVDSESAFTDVDIEQISVIDQPLASVVRIQFNAKATEKLKYITASKRKLILLFYAHDKIVFAANVQGQIPNGVLILGGPGQSKEEAKKIFSQIAE